MNGILNFLKKNWYYVAAVVLLIIVVVVVIRRKNNDNNNDNNNDGNGTNPTGVPDADAKFPLRPYALVNEYSTAKGSLGSQIKTLQMIYNKNAQGNQLEEDGKYGKNSLNAFRGFFYDMISTNGTITEVQYNAIIEKFN